MEQVVSGRRRRRRHSAEFKAEAIAACRQPGVSVAAAALERSLNANLLRRWVVEAERSEGIVAVAPLRRSGATFMALPVVAKGSEQGPIRIEVRRGALTVNVQWPGSAMHECALWLREVLK